MVGRIQSLYRHPIKGFTPEPVDSAMLEPGGYFPGDRLYAVERGPSGFNPAAPAFISKFRFTVLANHPRLARAVTAFDTATRTLSVTLDGETRRFDFDRPEDREAFTLWLTRFLGEDEELGPLRLLDAGPSHRFTDDTEGLVSVINLASVRDLGAKLGREIDPLRLRANVYVEGWAPWVELDWPAASQLNLGDCLMETVKPIPRCIATHVNPASGDRDLELLQGLRKAYGHVLCGLYLKPLRGGRIAPGDPADLVQTYVTEPSS